MRVAWLTPFNELSAIGRISQSVCEHLKPHCQEVTIIRSERDRSMEAAPLATGLPMRWWQDVNPIQIGRDFDIVAVTVGDNFEFHAGVLPFLSQVTCLGIIHDFHIYGLFHGWLASIPNPEQQHDLVIRQYYGDENLEFSRQARRGEATLKDISLRIPMLEWVSSRCGGAMVHANFYRARVEQSCAGPVRMAYLSQSPRTVPPRHVHTDGEIVISTVGIINPNKCADAVIRAISLSDLLRTRCRYRLVGAIEESHRLHLVDLARRLGVTKFDILGRVNDDVLVDELSQTDVFCCLRRPVLEGASASVIEAMMSGRPAVVCNAGFYAELPDDCVLKIPSEFSDMELAAGLERLVRSPQTRSSLGEAGRHWARTQFSTDKYVEVLLDLMKQFVAAKPAQELVRRLGKDLAEIKVGAGDPVVSRIAVCLNDLLNSTTHTNAIQK